MQGNKVHQRWKFFFQEQTSIAEVVALDAFLGEAVPSD